MSAATLIPDPKCLRLECIVSGSQLITLIVTTIRPLAACPACGQASKRIHSRYERKVADLPWNGVAVCLRLRSRKFFCTNDLCTRAIFTERLPSVVARYARRTARLNEALRMIGYIAGGEAGARLAVVLGYSASPDTLLQRVRQASTVAHPTPRVLGVDDWAKRRGQSYGTILVDLERQCTIDLLPDREAETLTNWLKAHPGVEIVTRDRSRAYLEGITSGAPSAVQIADRWHLIKNLSEALERLLIRQHRLIREATNPVVELPQPAQLSQPEPQSQQIEEVQAARRFLPPRLDKGVSERRAHHLALFQEVIELKQQGLRCDEIARRVGKSVRTIRRWLAQGEYRERVRHRRRILDAHLPYIAQRWDEGCHNVMEVWRELVGRGYRGSYQSLINYLHRQPDVPCGAAPPSPVEPTLCAPVCQAKIRGLTATPSPRKTAWMMLKPEELEEEQRDMLDRLCNRSAEVKRAKDLALSFLRMVRQRQAERLDGWISEVKESRIPELESLADGLEQDKKAVEAALKYEWSNGPVEGHVNRLKLVKREMFGRAKLDLLKARVMKAA